MFPSGDQWKQLDALFYKCLELPPEARSAFLDQHCGDDHELRKELEALLKEVEEPLDFLQEPVLEAAHELVVHSESTLMAPGTRLGEYEIISLFATGGMGQVYLAKDITLKRRVALKVLSPEFTRDGYTTQRFEREAQAASALNHPNILTIYACGETDGLRFIVSEFVEGSTLREKLAAGRLELNAVLDISVQIATALDAAHSAGIIHRDIKPENLMVRSDGLLKVLDFGIAKLTRPNALRKRVGGGVTTPTTQPALLIGTAAYMSPEQATGKDLDTRTDLFSFGVVLYEMTTGVSPFLAETAGDILENILTRTPAAVTQLNPEAPAKLKEIINKGLEKDRNLRYQHASEMRADLQSLKRDTDSDILPAVRKSAAASKARVWFAIAAAVIAAAVLGTYLASRRPAKLTEKDTIVLSDFSNNTGDTVFDDTLRTALTVALNQSPFLNVLSDTKVSTALGLMTRPPDTRLTPEVVQELCQRTGSKAYIGGSIASLGNEYVLGLKAVNCQSGDTLAEELVTANSKEQVLEAMGRAAAKLRSELGESLATIQKFDIPLEEATTSSLEALKAYSLGGKASILRSSEAALPYFQHAVDLDPNFAMGFYALGAGYESLGELERAAEYATKAFKLREHASERERLLITATYYLDVTGELDKAAEAYQQEIESYPRSATGYFGLCVVYAAQGQYVKASETTRRGLELQPDEHSQYENLVNYLVALQRFDEARRAIHEALARKVDDYILHNVLYALAFLAADTTAMAEELRWYAGKTDVEHNGLSLASGTEAFAGHLRKARELTRLAVDAAIRADSKENGAIWLENAALREAAFGNSVEARKSANEGLRLDITSQGVRVEAALAYAMAGDTARAQAMANALTLRYPFDTQLQSLWLPSIRGQLELNRKEAEAAVKSLQLALPPIEYGQIGFVNNMSCLYPTFIRGEAYLASGQGTPAAAEFQKILDHDGIVWNCWTGALAQLGLARANVLQSKTSQAADADAARVRALSAYKDFLTLWKDADPDIPILKQAKAEYALLR